jgi:hypothetical protein
VGARPGEITSYIIILNHVQLGVNKRCIVYLNSKNNWHPISILNGTLRYFSRPYR